MTETTPRYVRDLFNYQRRGFDPEWLDAALQVWREVWTDYPDSVKNAAPFYAEGLKEWGWLNEDNYTPENWASHYVTAVDIARWDNDQDGFIASLRWLMTPPNERKGQDPYRNTYPTPFG